MLLRGSDCGPDDRTRRSEPKDRAASLHPVPPTHGAPATDECPFAGEVEVDESYFGAHRVRRRRGARRGPQDAGFGTSSAGAASIPRSSETVRKATLQAIILGRIDPSASIHSDGWAGYDGLVRRASPSIIASATTTRFCHRERRAHQRHRELLELRQASPGQVQRRPPRASRSSSRRPSSASTTARTTSMGHAP